MTFERKKRIPNELIEIEIGDVGFGGDGVGRLGGVAVFVPYTLPGELVRARVFEKKKKYWKAWPKEILRASPQRIPHRCKHYKLCAGCSYQHVPYEVEREIKKNQVCQLMQRIGHLTDVPVSLMPIPDSLVQNHGYHYRNRATVHRQKRDCGFFKHDNHQVFSVEECPISAPALEDLIREEAEQPEGLPRADLRVDSDGNPVSQAQAWFMVNVQQHSYKIPLDSFFQTHYEGAAQIITAIRSWISGLPGRDLLIDAYGGVGLFSAALADAYSKTVLIELDQAAVETARENMRNNQPEARFEAHASPVETTLSGLLRAHDPRRTHVILDPPRIGLQPQIIDILLARTPQFVFYISCDPSKMARDLSRLSAHYRVRSIQLVDMFPRTAHIESIAFLECSKEVP